MWFLNFLSEESLKFILNIVLTIGVFSTIVSFFVIDKIKKILPAVTPYVLIIQIVSIVVLTMGVYFKGSFATEQTWRAQVKIVEEKLKAAEIESKKINVVIEEKIVYQDRIIKEKGETRIQYIDRVIKEKEEIIKFVETCPIPKDILIQHNLATEYLNNQGNQ